MGHATDLQLYTVASRLISALERLLGMGNPTQTDLIILSTLELLQGLLLLHPPSKHLFRREIHMNLLLDLLDDANPPRIQSLALLVIVTALVGCPPNTRVFEATDGLLTVTTLFKSKSVTKEVRMRALEFLYFYLMPEETPHRGSSSAPNTTSSHQTPMNLHAIFSDHARTHSSDAPNNGWDDDELGTIRSMQDKQRCLGKYLSNVDELVHDLAGSLPFRAVHS